MCVCACVCVCVRALVRAHTHTHIRTPACLLFCIAKYATTPQNLTVCATCLFMKNGTQWMDKYRKRIQVPYLIPCSRLLLEMVIVAQLVNTFFGFCGTRQFIIVFTRALRLSLPLANWIKLLPPTGSHNAHFNIIIPSTPGSSELSLSYKLTNHNLARTVMPPMRTASFSSWIDCSHNILRRVQIMKTLIM
jgi:hypothetical protein